MATARGRVAEKHGLLLTTVVSLDPPVKGVFKHPFPLFLTPRQLNGAKEGDEVELAYSTPNKVIGEWTVVKVLGKLW